MIQLHTLKQKTHALNTQIYALYLSYRDNRVKWYARTLLAFAIGYALSPIDLIPDLKAVFGFLDDVLVVALSFHFSYHLLSKNVVGQAKLQAFEELNSSSASMVAAAYRIIGYAWMLALAIVLVLLYKFTALTLF
ncbi:YkvA family protein [uncultured Pontibacter sp.]|uniref:YkvA family protein n=1 Tax=uncultured Pontibacter sp. TaxID=453356 RepID=UPI0026347681|nr:YkvA family protein [uncultured Pontibacter sp.]